ncbi:uncharacterized protein LOC8036519 [Ixodes scapularis]|uniref:uncharacterized protein LOC8036519 n=1 Tax=Ixodes scapularis TaxID=6945 RepID=UPI001A9F49E4|nr:uncharacterized protein LOC8036519 [Ixodes scapularis]
MCQNLCCRRPRPSTTMQPAVVSLVVFLSVCSNSQSNGFHLILPEESTIAVSSARSFPVAAFPLALAIIGPLVAVFFGSLKPLLLSFGVFYLFLFALTFVPTLSAIVQSGFRAFGNTLAAAVPPTAGEDLLKAVGLDGEECRTRAVCEITEDAVQRYPTLAAMLRSLSGAVMARDGSKYVLKGLLGGLSGLGCESLYATCKQSPFERVMKIMSVKAV